MDRKKSTVLVQEFGDFDAQSKQQLHVLEDVGLLSRELYTFREIWRLNQVLRRQLTILHVFIFSVPCSGIVAPVWLRNFDIRLTLEFT